MEPRRRPRAPYKGWVEIVCQGRRVRAEGHDLSVDGIGLAFAPDEAEVADAIVSEFALPGIALPLELSGQLVWSDREGCRAGIRFDDVDAGLAELLSNFVAGRL